MTFFDTSVKTDFYLITKTFLFLFKRKDPARIFVAMLFFTLLLFLVYVSYFAGSKLSFYFDSFGSFTATLTDYILVTLSTSLSIFAFFSYAISFYFIVAEESYRSYVIKGGKKLNFISNVFIKSFVFGSWPYLLISIPFFLPFMLKNNPFYLGLFRLVFSQILLALIVMSIAAIIVIVTYPYIRVILKKYYFLFIPLVMIFIYLIFSKIVFPYNLPEIAKNEDISIVKIRLLDTPVFISYQPALVFVKSLTNRFELFLITLQGLISFLGFLFISKNKIIRIWQDSYEERFGLSFYKAKNINISYLTKKLNSKISVLVLNEVLFILRSPYAFGYLIFVSSLYVVLLFFLSKATILTSDYKQFDNIVMSASFLSITYLILLLNIRFIFPAISLGEKFLWSSITAEKKKRNFFRFKWVYNFMILIFTVYFLSFLAIMNNQIIRKAASDILPHLIFTSILIIFTSLFIGSLYHKAIKDREVEKLATTIPGIIVTIASLFFSIFFLWVFYNPWLNWHYIVVYILSFLIMAKLYIYAENRFISDDLG